MSEKDKNTIKDNMLAEMERVAKAYRAKDMRLELDIQRAINTFRSHAKLPPEDIKSFDEIMHNLGSLEWKRQPDLPEEKVTFVGGEKEESLQFLRTLIQKVADGAVWELPSTHQKYRIDKQQKVFVLVRDTQLDEHNWHGKTKFLLRELGWRMEDGRDKTYVFLATSGSWTFSLVSFLIDRQENTATPGENFPPGSRGNDCIVRMVNKGVVLNLGHKIGAAMAATIPLLSGKTTEKEPSSPYGLGKSVASSSFLKDKKN